MIWEFEVETDRGNRYRFEMENRTCRPAVIDALSWLLLRKVPVRSLVAFSAKQLQDHPGPADTQIRLVPSPGQAVYLNHGFTLIRVNETGIWARIDCPDHAGRLPVTERVEEGIVMECSLCGRAIRTPQDLLDQTPVEETP